MKRKRIVMIVAALILGLTGALTATVVPSSAAANKSSSLAATAKFWYKSLVSATDLCIGMTGGFGTANTCTYENGQLFHFGAEKVGYYQLINDLGTCMGVEGQSLDANAKIEIGTCNTSHDAQFWTEDWQPSLGGYALNNYRSGYYITIVAGKITSGAPLLQEPLEGYTDQVWERPPT